MQRNIESKTRNAILQELKLNGALTTRELALRFELSSMAIRLQMDSLSEEGMVKSENVVKGRGRPDKIWSLSEKAQNIFPDAHQNLTLQLLENVKGVFGVSGLDKIIEAHGKTQLANYLGKLEGKILLIDRLEKLCMVRSEEGYMAGIEKLENGFLFFENHCPICAAAKACSGLCKNELKLFSQCLGERVLVERSEHIIAGARRCAYQIIEKA